MSSLPLVRQVGPYPSDQTELRLNKIIISFCSGSVWEGIGRHASTVLRGVIDLAFKETAAWAIVDSASDRITTGPVKDLVEVCTPHVVMYADAWGTMMAEPVMQAGLHLTHPRRMWEWLNVEEREGDLQAGQLAIFPGPTSRGKPGT